jgi:hypothetical protein
MHHGGPPIKPRRRSRACCLPPHERGDNVPTARYGRAGARNLEGHGTNLSQALSSVCWESVCDRACVPCRCTAPVYPSSGVVSRRCNCFAICNSSNSSAQGEGTERSSVPEHRKGWMENHSTPRSVPTSPDVTSPVTCNFTSEVIYVIRQKLLAMD